VSNAAMLSAHKAGEGPILVAGSSDIRSRAGSVFQSKKRLRLRLETDLPDPTAARLGQTGAKCLAISAPASTASTVPSGTNFHAK
jgi:hypothetical protein